MKKTSNYLHSVLFCASSLLLVIQSCSSTQKGEVTAKIASSSKEYSVINTGESILLYKYMHKAHSAKEVDKYAPKYYFTTASSDVLKDLTKENLKKAFPTNHAFHNALDAHFNSDAELINYDTFHKMYKLNWLLKNNQ